MADVVARLNTALEGRYRIERDGQLQFSTSRHGRTLYMSLAELESDVYMMDLTER